MLRSLLAHIVTQWGPCPVATNCWKELNSLGSNWMDITTDLMRTGKEQTAIFMGKSSFQKRSRQLKLDIVNNKEHYLGYRSTSVWCYRHIFIFVRVPGHKCIFNIHYFGNIFPLKNTRLDGIGLLGDNVSQNPATWFCKTSWIEAKWPKNTVCQSTVPHFERLAKFFGKHLARFLEINLEKFASNKAREWVIRKEEKRKGSDCTLQFFN